MSGPTLPPTPARVAEYFQRRRHRIVSYDGDDLAANERLWLDVCGLPDALLPPLVEVPAAIDPFADHTKFGPIGQITSCTGCGRKFESCGLRLCPECYPVLGDRDDLKRFGDKSAAERPVRRQLCACCRSPLPTRAETGRRTRSSNLFCSDLCRSRGARDLAAEDSLKEPDRVTSRAGTFHAVPVQSNQVLAGKQIASGPVKMRVKVEGRYLPRRRGPARTNPAAGSESP